jgi:hypothetical protein
MASVETASKSSDDDHSGLEKRTIWRRNNKRRSAPNPQNLNMKKVLWKKIWARLFSRFNDYKI